MWQIDYKFCTYSPYSQKLYTTTQGPISCTSLTYLFTQTLCWRLLTFWVCECGMLTGMLISSVVTQCLTEYTSVAQYVYQRRVKCCVCVVLWSHLWFAGVRECPPWCSIVGATVTAHQFFCILHFSVGTLGFKWISSPHPNACRKRRMQWVTYSWIIARMKGLLCS